MAILLTLAVLGFTTVSHGAPTVSASLDARRFSVDQAAPPGQDKERSQSGKMTSDEARQLLHRLKDEEGRLNFVLQTENGEAGKEGKWKDW